MRKYFSSHTESLHYPQEPLIWGASKSCYSIYFTTKLLNTKHTPPVDDDEPAVVVVVAGVVWLTPPLLR